MSFQRLPISEQVDQNMLSTLQAISPADERFQIQLKNVRFPDVAGNTSPADMDCVFSRTDMTSPGPTRSCQSIVEVGNKKSRTSGFAYESTRNILISGFA